MERYFQISFHALILTAFLGLAGTGRVTAPTVLIFLAAFTATAHRTLTGRPPLLTAHLAFYLSAAYVVFFFLDGMVLSRSFVSAIIHMVLFLELAKMAQRKNDKDYLYLILLAFLQILAASSLTIDISFVVTLALFLVALVSTLMSFDVARSERRRRVRQDTGQPRVGAALAGMSVWASIWIVIVGVGLFFAIPRIGTGYFSRAESQALLISGFSESVRLGEIGEVKLSSALVMRTRVLDGTSMGLPKWRGIALDTFDGEVWSKTPSRRSPIRRVGSDAYVLPEDPGGPSRIGTSDLVRFEIFLEPIASTSLFGPHAIREIRGDFGGALERDSMDSIFQRAIRSRRVRYEVLSELPNRLARIDETLPGEGSGGPVLEDAERYLQVPEDLDERIADLARSVTAAGTTTMEKASLIELHLKRDFDYSLVLDWDPGDSPLGTFLFDARSGHCEYFASSMAIMLRTIGIPTRMVNGFLTGEYNPVGKSYAVRQSDAHSWVEVWLPGWGWVDFDPTPPDPNEGESSLATLMTNYMDALDLFWNSYVLTYDSDLQFQLFRSAQDMAENLRSGLREESRNWMAGAEDFADQMTDRLQHGVATHLFWVAFSVVGGGAAAFRYRRPLTVVWKTAGVRLGRRRADVDVVGALFGRARSLAGRPVAPRAAHETWREWVGKIPDTDRQAMIRTALGIYEKARYGAGAVSDEDFARMESVVAALRALR